MRNIKLSIFIDDEKLVKNLKEILTGEVELAFYTTENSFLRSFKENQIDAGIINIKHPSGEIKDFLTNHFQDIPIISFSDDINAEYVNMISQIGINRFITVNMGKEKILSLIAECANINKIKEYLFSLVVKEDKHYKHIKSLINIIIDSQPKRLGENEISERLNISKRWLQKICLASFNISYLKLLRKLNIYIALRLMYYTKLDNKEISLQLNYQNYDSFLKDFKNELNLTPSEARIHFKTKKPRELIFGNLNIPNEFKS